ncbi:MAG: hypothetical protein CM1200mP16_00550 [Nitrospina sp.]|nr:MAG: hypothetical protein CM1200mP16_00550 [Nitrospina sp.]
MRPIRKIGFKFKKMTQQRDLKKIEQALMNEWDQLTNLLNRFKRNKGFELGEMTLPF